MKVTQDQLIDLAVKAGVPVVEVVADSKDSDYDETTALQAIQAATKELIKPAIESELRTSLETQLKGKFSGETYSLLARESGMTRAELEKLPISEAAKLAFKHLGDKLGGDASTWKKELEDLVETHNKTLTAKETEWNGKISAATQRYVDRDINSYLAENIVGKAPLLATADKAFWAEQLRSHLQSKYHLSYDDAKKAVSTFKKDNIEIPALNEAGTATINLMDEFKGLATKAGVWTTDKRNEKPDPNRTTTTTQTQARPQVNTSNRGKKVSTEAMSEYLATKLEEAGL